MIGKMTEEDMQDMLTDSSVGRIGCSSGGITYIVPVNYVYQDGDIYIRGVEGQKTKMMRDNPAVCFEIDHISNSKNWRSLIIHGVSEEVKDEMERYEAMKLFVERSMSLKLSSTAITPEAAAGKAGVSLVVFRIKVLGMSGRYEHE